LEIRQVERKMRFNKKCIPARKNFFPILKINPLKFIYSAKGFSNPHNFNSFVTYPEPLTKSVFLLKERQYSALKINPLE